MYIQKKALAHKFPDVRGFADSRVGSPGIEDPKKESLHLPGGTREGHPRKGSWSRQLF